MKIFWKLCSLQAQKNQYTQVPNSRKGEVDIANSKRGGDRHFKLKY